MDGRGRTEVGAQLLKVEGRLLPGPVDHNDVCILCTGTRGVAARAWDVPLGLGVAGRLQHVALFAGGAAAHVLNIYSPVGETAEAAAQCVELVQAAMAVAAGLGPVPIFLGGDFNKFPLPLHAQFLLAAWTDLTAHDDGATTLPGGGRSGRRIDRVFCNHAALALGPRAAVRWDLGLATHAAIQVTFSGGPPPTFPARVRAAALHGPAGPDWTEERATRMAYEIWEPRCARFLADLEEGNVDRAWRNLCGAAEQYLSARLDKNDGCGRRVQGAAVRERPAFQPQKAGGREGEAASAVMRATLLRLRQLENLVKLWPEGPGALPAAARQVLAACRRGAATGEAPDPAWIEALDGLGDRGAAARLCDRARGEYLAAASANKRQRAEGWHTYVQEQFRTGGRRVFQWIRSPASAAPPPLVATGTGLVGGPAAELQVAAAAWIPLWQQTDQPPAQEAAWLALLADLPAFPQLPDLGLAELQAGLSALPGGKAPGLDDWLGEELRLWPPPLVAALWKLLQAVERLGRWPAGLRGAEVVLPLKPGGDPAEPLDRRPLNLLSVVYRCWARLRGRHVAAWRRLWDPAVAAARLGADGQAWELAWAQAEAEAGDQEFAGLAVDFRKAYDSVRLGLVRRLLAAAGWPLAIVGPLLDAYRAPRRLRVAGALGEPFLPTSGIPAGCPIAVDVLAVLTWAWHRSASMLMQAGLPAP